MKFSQKERIDLFKAWIVISIAFAIAFFGFQTNLFFLFAILFSGITVGVGFLLHELSHKLIANHYGCWAEFRSFDQMLFLALIMSFFGFIFAAPGAVLIQGAGITRRQNGHISVAGPITNLVLAVLFIGLIFIPHTAVSFIGFYGFLINSWLAAFNLIPVWNFDGKKVFNWNKAVWGVLLAIAIGFMFLQTVLPKPAFGL